VVLARGGFERSAMIQKLVPAYRAVLDELARLGVPEVQLHEPVLTLAKAPQLRADAEYAYGALAAASVPLHLVVAYDNVADDVYPWLTQLPVHAIGLDFCGVPGATHGNATCNLIARHGFPAEKRLGVGVIDARSPWADNGTAAHVVAAVRKLLGPEQRLTVQTSTSLQHVPLDLALEKELPADVKPRLAFAVQKLGELVAVAQAVAAGTVAGPEINLATYTGAPVEGAAAKAIPAEHFQRSAPFSVRRPQQPQFPAFPTTTIGSFPQTPTIRRARLQYKKGQLSETEYREVIGAEIGYSIGAQEALGLDVLVHGEAERTDMVEYFGRKLKGFVFTEHAWVQSYGSRYVRPPIIAGDVVREAPMTVHEFKLAQGMTNRAFVKGMLTVCGLSAVWCGLLCFVCVCVCVSLSLSLCVLCVCVCVLCVCGSGWCWVGCRRGTETRPTYHSFTSLGWPN
jgi:5-methyltetrahydropteroyltriglutamate--homocysteine methyltransferase